MSVELVIAVRGGAEAKSRLSSRLDADRRAALAEAMLEDMLQAFAGPDWGLSVTTPTPELARLAGQMGARVWLDQDAGGLNGAFARAQAQIAAEREDATIVLLPGDLPLVRREDVAACIAARNQGMAVAPARDDAGTGALVLPAKLPLRLAFGADSFRRHMAAARELGLEPAVIRTPGLQLDLDKPEDLDEFLPLAESGRTADILRAAQTIGKTAA